MVNCDPVGVLVGYIDKTFPVECDAGWPRKLARLLTCLPELALLLLVVGVQDYPSRGGIQYSYHPIGADVEGRWYVIAAGVAADGLLVPPAAS
jgi:hypothetical protein